MDEQTETKAKPRKNWLRILLGVSLALNLLVVGIVVGAAFRFGGPDGARRPPPSIGATLYRELSFKDRRALRSSMQNAPRERRQRHQAESEQLDAALRATPFEAQEVERLLKSQAQFRTDWQAAVQRAWLDRVSGMDDSERAAYADRLQLALKKHRKPLRDREKVPD